MTSYNVGMIEEPKGRRMRFVDSWAIRAGVLLLIVGTGPLVAIGLAAKLGLTADPNPNPIGPGILAGLTFLPSMIIMLVGIVRVIVVNRRVK